MSTVLRAKRSLERKARRPIEFRLGSWGCGAGDAPVEAHVIDDELSSTDSWLGSGDTHLEAIEDARKTLKRGKNWEKRGE